MNNKKIEIQRLSESRPGAAKPNTTVSGYALLKLSFEIQARYVWDIATFKDDLPEILEKFGEMYSLYLGPTTVVDIDDLCPEFKVNVCVTIGSRNVSFTPEDEGNIIKAIEDTGLDCGVW